MHTQRQKVILEQLIRQKQVCVKELAATLYASESSIRRDLAALEAQHLLRRVHGGAIIEENGISSMKIPFLIRELEQSNEKLLIAQKAAALVKDGDVLFLDASSSAYALIPFLSARKNLTVITNGVKALQRLCEYNISTISTGGNASATCLSLSGEDARRTIRGYHATLCFFSCRGLSAAGELSDIYAAEDVVRQEMIANAASAYLLCAGKKYGKIYYHRLCTVQDIAGVISDIALPENFKGL